jgi:hypothetical protein
VVLRSSRMRCLVSCVVLLLVACGHASDRSRVPTARVGMTPTGGFTVNEEPFVPMGFYYLWESITGDVSAVPDLV